MWWALEFLRLEAEDQTWKNSFHISDFRDNKKNFLKRGTCLLFLYKDPHRVSKEQVKQIILLELAW